jgi:hypothetical protein
MSGASEETRSAQRIGSTWHLFERRLDQTICLQSAQGVVINHARHHDVAFPHRASALFRQSLITQCA